MHPRRHLLTGRKSLPFDDDSRDEHPRHRVRQRRLSSDSPYYSDLDDISEQKMKESEPLPLYYQSVQQNDMIDEFLMADEELEQFNLNRAEEVAESEESRTEEVRSRNKQLDRIQEVHQLFKINLEVVRAFHNLNHRNPLARYYSSIYTAITQESHQLEQTLQEIRWSPIELRPPSSSLCSPHIKEESRKEEGNELVSTLQTQKDTEGPREKKTRPRRRK